MQETYLMVIFTTIALLEILFNNLLCLHIKKSMLEYYIKHARIPIIKLG